MEMIACDLTAYEVQKLQPKLHKKHRYRRSLPLAGMMQPKL
jgi:hypothetical protein